MPDKDIHRSSAFSDSPIQMPSLVSNEACQMVLEHAHGGVWIIDLTGITTYVNASMAQMIGYAREEMIGRTFFDFMDAEGKQISSKNLEQRRQGQSAIHKFRLKHKDNSDVWVLVAANPLRDSVGTIIGALAFITEIGAIDTATENLTEQSEPQIKSETKLIELENIVLDPNTLEVWINSRLVKLSVFSFKLLRYFLENANRLINRQDFLDKVWKDSTLDDRVIDAHIVALRKKLRGFHGEIKTVYGIGYILKTGPRGKR